MRSYYFNEPPRKGFWQAWGDFWWGVEDFVMEKLMMPFLMLCVVGLLGFLALCGVAGYRDYRAEKADPMHAGVVMKHNYRPATTTYMLAGKVMVPITTPESYTLTLEGKTEHGKIRDKDVSVTRWQWENTQDGTELQIE
jgi:hypothetical protein